MEFNMSDQKIAKLLKTVFTACQDVKGVDIQLLDLRKISSYADYIVLVSGASDRQVKALADRILDEAHKKCHASPLGIEGFEASQWILVDFGDIVCHVFLEEARPLYHIEHMWPRIRPMTEPEIAAFLSPPKKAPRKAPAKKPAAAKKTVLRKKS
jgi:ribosome-associated protein